MMKLAKGLIQTNKEINKYKLDTPSDDELLELATLSLSDSPFDAVYRKIKLDRARLIKMENQTVRQLIKDYAEVMKDLKRDLKAIDTADFKNVSEMVKFVQSTEILRVVDARLAELLPTASFLEKQLIISARFGVESYLKELETLIQIGALSEEWRYKVMSFNYPNLRVVEDILPLVMFDTQRLAEDARKHLLSVLREGAIKGQSFPQIVKLAVDSTIDLTAVRASKIARWSIIKSFNQERLATMQELQLPRTGKMWLGMLDDRICPHCLALHGQIIKFDGEFDGDRTFANKPLDVYLDLKTPPRHVNCRCSIVPWREEWRWGAFTTPEKLWEDAINQADSLGYTKGAGLTAPKPIYKPEKDTWFKTEFYK